MAYAANLDLPKNMETKLLKAVQIFHEGYLDPMSIEPWAKKNTILNHPMVIRYSEK